MDNETPTGMPGREAVTRAREIVFGPTGKCGCVYLPPEREDYWSITCHGHMAVASALERERASRYVPEAGHAEHTVDVGAAHGCAICLRIELRMAEARAAELLGTVRDLEWLRDRAGGEALVCPLCWRTRDEGHSRGCTIQRELERGAVLAGGDDGVRS